MVNRKRFLVLCGPSGSGKTTIAEHMEYEYGLRSVQSYTSRPMRYPNEKGHTFVTVDEVLNKSGVIAYTVFNGYHYCTTVDQVEDSDVVVLDFKGINDLLDMYKGDKEIVIVFIRTGFIERGIRMLKRGDGFRKTVKRLFHDIKAFRRSRCRRIDYVISGDDSIEAAKKIAWYV